MIHNILYLYLDLLWLVNLLFNIAMNYIQKFGVLTNQEKEEIEEIIRDHVRQKNEENTSLTNEDFYEVTVDQNNNHILNQITDEERRRWNGRRRTRRDPYPKFLNNESENNFLNPRVNNFIGPRLPNDFFNLSYIEIVNLLFI